jgi:hypothetical protein
MTTVANEDGRAIVARIVRLRLNQYQDSQQVGRAHWMDLLQEVVSDADSLTAAGLTADVATSEVHRLYALAAPLDLGARAALFQDYVDGR